MPKKEEAVLDVSKEMSGSVEGRDCEPHACERRSTSNITQKRLHSCNSQPDSGQHRKNCSPGDELVKGISQATACCVAGAEHRHWHEALMQHEAAAVAATNNRAADATNCSVSNSSMLAQM